MKTCFKCRKSKPESEFGRHAIRPDGLRSNCKECERKPPRLLACKNCGEEWKHGQQGSAPNLCPPCETTLNWCNRCKQAKPHAEFYACKPTRTGLHQICKPCGLTHREQPKVKRRKRETEMLRIYGMSHEDFDRRLADQGGQCACCGRISDQMVVDHDHVTDVVRGIVCFGCNTGFGKLGDQAEGAHRAEMYLWKSRDLLAEFASGRHTLAEMFQAQVA